MAFRAYKVLLGASLLLAPGFALAQQEGTVPPTAEGAASQVEKSPKAALDENGKRVEPSEKLWNNPRTQAEQPGTQPPSNAAPADPAGTRKKSEKAWHKAHSGQHHGTHNEEGQSITSPHEGAKSN